MRKEGQGGPKKPVYKRADTFSTQNEKAAPTGTLQKTGGGFCFVMLYTRWVHILATLPIALYTHWVYNIDS